MKALREIANDLRKVADQLDKAGNPQPLPRQVLTMTEAAAHLGVVCETVQIQVTYWAKGLGEPHLEFSVWDGAQHYTAATLAAAVDACLEAHRAAAAGPPTPGVIDAVLDNAAAPAF